METRVSRHPPSAIRHPPTKPSSLCCATLLTPNTTMRAWVTLSRCPSLLAPRAPRAGLGRDGSCQSSCVLPPVTRDHLRIPNRGSTDKRFFWRVDGGCDTVQYWISLPYQSARRKEVKKRRGKRCRCRNHRDAHSHKVTGP